MFVMSMFLGELQRRSLNIDLPASANFQNELELYHFDEKVFQPAAPLPRYPRGADLHGLPARWRARCRNT